MFLAQNRILRHELRHHNHLNYLRTFATVVRVLYKSESIPEKEKKRVRNLKQKKC